MMVLYVGMTVMSAAAMTVMFVGSWYDSQNCWQLVWQSCLLVVNMTVWYVGMTVRSVGSWYDSHVCW